MDGIEPPACQSTVRVYSAPRLNQYSAHTRFFDFQLSVWEWQFGQTKRRFSNRSSSGLPLMWSICRTNGFPFQESISVQCDISQRYFLPRSNNARFNWDVLVRFPFNRNTRICSADFLNGLFLRPEFVKCSREIPSWFIRIEIIPTEPPHVLTPSLMHVSLRVVEFAAAFLSWSSLYFFGFICATERSWSAWGSAYETVLRSCASWLIVADWGFAPHEFRGVMSRTALCWHHPQKHPREDLNLHASVTLSPL